MQVFIYLFIHLLFN